MGKCFIVSEGMDAPDSIYLLLQSINQLFYFAKSINFQIKSHPSLNGKTHFFNEKKTKSVPVFEGQKMVTLV